MFWIVFKDENFLVVRLAVIDESYKAVMEFVVATCEAGNLHKTWVKNILKRYLNEGKLDNLTYIEYLDRLRKCNGYNKTRTESI